MKTRNKVMMLTLATVGFSIGGLMALPKTTANANTDTPAFYMETGASVNIDDESYGGIRWTTVIEEGYAPISGADASNVKFGTFVVPTKMYENAVANTEIKDMTDVVDIKSDVTGEDALSGEIVYHSAIKYDDIIEDYKRANNIDELSATEETEILTEAYQMELTAVSYALYEGEYYYATAVETSRSARQVANIAILSNLLGNASPEKTNQINSYVETGADDFARTKLDNASEGYLDLTELSASEVVEQAIDVSGLSVDFTNDVAEVLVGANRLTTNDYTYADGTLSLKKASAGLEAGKETWLSVFTTNGNVYSLPVIPADGVITTAQELNDVFGVKNSQTSYKADTWTEKPLYGYYVLGNDIVGDGNGEYYTMTTTTEHRNGGTMSTSDVVDNKIGGFYGTFDGRGHTVSKIKSRARGIFCWLVNATVKNVGFKEITHGSNSSGSTDFLARLAYNTTFENVYIDIDFKASNGNAVIRYARSSTFNNFIVNVNEYSGANSSNARAWGLFGIAYAWDEVNGSTHYSDSTDNTFTNTYMISECMIAELSRKGSGDTETIGTCVDGTNWDEPTVGTSKNYKENQIKRYLDMTDMFDNVYYSYDDNGTVVKSTDTSENDWTAFDSAYWNIDTANKSISWK